MSPAYDINPVTPINGLHLNISDNDNSLNYKLAMDVIDFLRRSEARAVQIKSEVLASVGSWEAVAKKADLSGRLWQRLLMCREICTPATSSLSVIFNIFSLWGLAGLYPKISISGEKCGLGELLELDEMKTAQLFW